MNQKDIQLKSEVLKRVKTVFYMRTVVRPLLVEMALFIFTAVAVSFLVSVPNIILNLGHSSGWTHYGSYLASAFTHTRTAVQVLSTLSIIFFALLIKDILKNIKHLRRLNFA